MHWMARRSEWTQPGDDARTAFDVDYARIIHSGSFRRLQGKTQILNLGDSDFYRNRLTHSLEVAQIATSLVRQFRQDNRDQPVFDHLPEDSLIQVLGYTHDLGHPPFGHGGEVALNYCMRDHGGFEGNGQTLRILARLEKMSGNEGADLTRRALLGILKYPIPFSKAHNTVRAPRLLDGPSVVRLIDRDQSKPPKCYLNTEQDVVDWILAPLSAKDRKTFYALSTKKGQHSRARHKSFDCSIMDLADDISYGVHDFEDAIALGLIDQDAFKAAVDDVACASFLDFLKEKYPNQYGNNIYDKFVDQLFADGNTRKHTISRMVGFLINNAQIVEKRGFVEPLLRYQARMNAGPEKFLKALKDFIFDSVIKSPNVQHLEFKGQTMVVSVFETFASEPKSFLPSDAYALFEKSGEDMRVICDHIAGMTDAFLMKTYDRLFSPRMGSVFDRL
ncbi:MAG: dGTPase [Robiginitomaculum sp.]|nr:MAG: dGTPase [Robiginitomaculum sp.]